ncbi:transcriptional regulator, MarR family [Arboricoccus pini]|uniref:Transcriptional regulator, MarR family n=2 Tax=Arboricoccus pini TaxID=1963835 RepID=A0A212R0R9_9PROT|nr:transcriptional regulator, MarR family [Arboricoccus pini]
MPSRSAVNLEFFVVNASLGRVWRRRANELLRDFNLSHAQAWPLVLLHRAGSSLRVQNLAEELGLDASSLVRHLDQLVRSGLITREEDPLDRRAKRLALTIEGEQLAERINAAVNAFRDRIMEGITTEQLEATLDILRSLERRVLDPSSDPFRETPDQE